LKNKHRNNFTGENLLLAGCWRTSSEHFPIYWAAANWGNHVGFQVLTAEVIFWDITRCSSLEVNRRFGGTYCLHLQGRRISRARNQRESRWQAEQSVSRNFGLYRKQEGSGRVELSSGWHARRTKWNCQTPIGAHERSNMS
jgi:hypothetical protein